MICEAPIGIENEETKEKKKTKLVIITATPPDTMNPPSHPVARLGQLARGSTTFSGVHVLFALQPPRRKDPCCPVA